MKAWLKGIVHSTTIIVALLPSVVYGVAVLPHSHLLTSPLLVMTKIAIFFPRAIIYTFFSIWLVNGGLGFGVGVFS